MPAVCLCTRLRLHATDDAVIPCVLQRVAAGHHGRNDNLVVVESGNAQTFAGDRCRLDQQGVRRQIPYADRQRRLGQPHVQLSLQAHIGQLVGDIHALLVLSADNQVLEQTVACKTLGGGGIAHLIQVIQLDPDAIQQFLRLFQRQGAIVHPLPEQGVHILIEASGRNGVPAGLQLQQLLDKPERLARLVEITRRMGRDVVAGIRNLEQLCLAHRVGTLCRLAQGEVGIAAGIRLHRLTAFDDSFKEVAAGDVIALPAIQPGKSLPALPDDRIQSLLNNASVIDVDVTHTVIEVVADRENAVVQEHIQHRRIHIGGGKVTGGSALPVGVHRLQAAHGVGRDIEGVCLARGDRIVLLLQPLIGILRIGLTAARRHRVGADDQLSPPDNDGDVLQNVPESGRAALDDRQTLGLLIALGDKLRTVRLYDRHILIQVSDQLRDAGAFLNTEA